MVDMDRSLIHNFKDETKPKVKVNHIQPLGEDPMTILFVILNRVMYLENIGICLKRKIEIVGEASISK